MWQPLNLYDAPPESTRELKTWVKALAWMGLSGDILAHTIISPNPTLDIMQATGLALFGVNPALGAYHFLVHSLLAVAVVILITPDNILRRMKILE